MIFLKTEDEIELMRAANLLVGDTLAEIAKIIKPGVTTAQLNSVAEEYIRDHGAVPTFLGFPNPYKDAPSCRYDHRALVAYAQKVGKSINDLSYEEKLAFIIK